MPRKLHDVETSGVQSTSHDAVESSGRGAKFLRAGKSFKRPKKQPDPSDAALDGHEEPGRKMPPSGKGTKKKPEVTLLGTESHDKADQKSMRKKLAGGKSFKAVMSPREDSAESETKQITPAKKSLRSGKSVKKKRGSVLDESLDELEAQKSSDVGIGLRSPPDRVIPDDGEKRTIVKSASSVTFKGTPVAGSAGSAQSKEKRPQLAASTSFCVKPMNHPVNPNLWGDPLALKNQDNGAAFPKTSSFFKKTTLLVPEA